MRDGLIPNMFPDGSNEGLYHTADATLWFFHAVDRYLRVENPDAHVGFLASEPWEPAGAWCAGMGIPQPRVSAYSTGGPF